MPSNAINGVVGTDGIVHLNNTDIDSDNKNIITNAPHEFNKPATYQIHVIDTGEIYIGATANFHKRLKQHVYGLKSNKHENIKLQQSFNNSINLEVTVFPTETTEQAFQLEKELIKLNKNNDNFLNIRDSCQPPMTGRHHSDETKEKIREHHKKMYSNGYINPFTSRKHSEENKLKQSKFATKQWENPELRENKRLSQIERMKDPVNREISRQAAIDQWKDPDMQNLLLQKRREQFNDPVFRKKVTDSVIERMKDPANREISRQAAIDQWKNTNIRELKCKKTTINGKEFSSLSEALKETGIPMTTYYRRLKKGLI